MTSYLPWVRCPTCGAEIARATKRYQADLRAGVADQEAIDGTGIPKERFCCRARVIASVPQWCEPMMPPPDTKNDHYTYLAPTGEIRHIQAK